MTRIPRASSDEDRRNGESGAGEAPLGPADDPSRDAAAPAGGTPGPDRPHLGSRLLAHGVIHGRELHYVRLGRPRAPTIVFLHGITESRRYFERPASPLADRFDLVLPDLPGFGLSPKPSARYSMDLFRDSLRLFLVHHELHERPVHFVAHSLGCLIALEYAAAWRDHVDRMVLINLPRHFSSEEAHRIFWKGSPSYRKLLRDRSVRASLGQLRRSGLAMSFLYGWHFPWEVLADARKFTFLSLTSTLENCLLNYRVDEALQRVPARPTLLIHGDRDQVAPLDHVLSLPGIYPWMRLLSIPGSGHHVLHTHGRQVVGAIRSFLEPAGT